ncbi:MAG: primosomal replication protein N [Methylophilaceae bacterium]
MVNQLTLSGEVTSLEPLRYTPAGIPIVSFRLRHTSIQDEAGMKRQADCEVPVVAMAEMADKAKTLQVGDSIKVLGFLTKKSLKNDRLVLHVTKLDQLT